MSQTLTEKILCAATGRSEVTPGELVTVRVDAVIGHDTSVASFRILEKWGVTSVCDPDRIYLTADHFVPSPTVEAATQYRTLTGCIERFGITHWFPPGRGGICHALFPEQGLIRPGMVVVGSDSHTCTYGALGAFACGMGATDTAAAMALGETWLRVPESLLLRYTGAFSPWVSGKDVALHAIGHLGVNGALYKVMEFAGEGIHGLDMDSRFTICNMAVEGGAKSGVIAPDALTEAYVRERSQTPFTCHTSDADAIYAARYTFDAASIPPLVALPHSPGNVMPVADAPALRVDQVVIGSCTNGRLRDLRDAASVLRNRKVARHVRLLVIPATQQVYAQALAEGLIECFVEAGAMVAPPTCGPCFGGHMGLVAEDEVVVATTNRNFASRMGHKTARICLASPLTAAAAAVAGELVDPRTV